MAPHPVADNRAVAIVAEGEHARPGAGGGPRKDGGQRDRAHRRLDRPVVAHLGIAGGALNAGATYKTLGWFAVAATLLTTLLALIVTHWADTNSAK